jgi:hypothetical protein
MIPKRSLHMHTYTIDLLCDIWDHFFAPVYIHKCVTLSQYYPNPQFHNGGVLQFFFLAREHMSTRRLLNHFSAAAYVLKAWQVFA